ncbi:MAG: hypothetical protein GJU76_15280, partial [Gallionella sp.]|nr:hypothetical protein [Gallionella sp.]
MSRDPQADRERLIAIQRAAQGGDLQQAIELAEATLAEGLEHPLIFNVLALRHEQAGELAAAEGLLRRAVALDGANKAAR